MTPPTPAIVAQNAVRRLPRWALIALCAVYLMPGLIGRGPWKSADITAFGYMAELAQSAEGLSRWFDPLLLGIRPETPALLPYWIGAWAIQLAPVWINPDFAVRTVYALLLAGVFAATWYAAYYLARTPQAQPVAFAFGGEARPKDYARVIGDGAIMALIACLGLAQLGHETTPALAQLFFCSSLFYGVAAMPYRRIAPRIAAGLGIIGIALSGGPTMALALGAGSTFLTIAERQTRKRVFAENKSPADPGPSYGAGAIFTLAGATALAALLAWRLGQMHWSIALPGSHPGISLWLDVHRLIKLLIWFTWPAWPLAIWTVWRWRHRFTQRHLALPLWFAGMPLAATLSTDFSQQALLLALPALATLTAFALPTFQRSVTALIDWFTLLFFSGSAIIIWVVWLSMQTGFPSKPAANIARLAPGFVPEFSFWALLFAIGATVAWIWLVRWRTGRHQAALWKTLALPAGGAALCWMLVMTLWLPPLDYARSYVPQVRAITKHVGQPACLSEYGLSRPHIAALRYHGQFELRPITVQPACPWLLVNPDAAAQSGTLIDPRQWRLIGTLRRPTARNDDLRLYQKIGE